MSVTPQVWLPDFQIAAGYDNVAGLVTWESVTLPDGVTLPALRLYSRSDVGQMVVRGDGTLHAQGFAALRLNIPALRDEQYYFLRDTYCNGWYSGRVTVRAPLASQSYANYNAVLQLPKEVDLSRVTGGYLDVAVTLARMVEIV